MKQKIRREGEGAWGGSEGKERVGRKGKQRQGWAEEMLCGREWKLKKDCLCAR